MSGRALGRVRSRSMFDKPGKLRVFPKSGTLIALATAAGVVVGVVGPSSGQFFNFGGYQQGPQPQRGGGWGGGGWGSGGGFGGGGWFGNNNFEPPQQQAPQPRWERRRQTLQPVREDFSK